MAETPTPLPTPTATTLPGLLISEFLADPTAVSDTNGEWIELYNPTDAPVNLRGWVLADLGSERHVIGADLMIPSHGYVVLARKVDQAINGGVAAVYQYSSINLGNSADALRLLAPGDIELDRVEWGGASGLTIAPGLSHERTIGVSPLGWALAQSMWSGSAGDWGTPGSGYTPPAATATPTATPPFSATETLTVTLTPAVTMTATVELATPTPTAVASEETPTPTSTVAVGAPPGLLISEFLADPNSPVTDNNGEWIELHNPTDGAVNLRGWTLASLDGQAHTIAADLILPAGGYLVLGRNADPALNGGVGVAYTYTGLSLSNTTDSILLIAPDGTEIDRVVWGSDGLTITPGASLERMNLEAPAVWATAWAPWPGSGGNLGTPGAAHSAPPTPTSTPTPEPTITPTVTLVSTPPPPLRISEFLADPKAVSDNLGEWIELYNPTDAAVQLQGWTIADLGGERHTITADLWIAPAGYLVLARNGEPLTNGGVTAAYLYTGISLANGGDSLLLLAPDGTQVDQVVWGNATDYPIVAGASYERATWDEPGLWSLAQTAWPGSAGDRGTPGSAYTPLPLPTVTPTAILLPTPTPTPPVGPPPRLLISEFLADPKAVTDTLGEWIEIYNAEATAVNLRGWALADDGGEYHLIAEDVVIPAGGYIVLARTMDTTSNGGVVAHYAYTGISLANSEDEIRLIAPGGVEVDRVAWGGDSALDLKAGRSAERAGFAEPATWVIATTPWIGSAGDAGTPGSPAIAPTPTPAPGGTPTPSATISPTPFTGPLPPIWITEFLADPKAVDDRDGEWIELYNGGNEAINLRGWVLADAGREAHTIATDLVVPPGIAIILARNGDFTANGGVLVHYVYSGIALGNSQDAIRLLAPNGALVDQVTWGGETGIKPQAGKSMERVTLSADSAWTVATAAWPTSAGDQGSPGSAYTPALPAPTGTPGPVPTATPTPLTGPAPQVLISEFLADPKAVTDSNGEWIELYNASAQTVNLRNWILADAGKEHVIAADLIVAPGEYVVLGRNGNPATNGGVVVHYVYSGLSLGNTEDSIRLFAPDHTIVDQVSWGGETGLKPKAGVSLERTPPAADAAWVPATAPWPGSAGDLGSPGGQSATPTPTPTGTVTPTDGRPPRILITEFLADPKAVNDSDGEWIELYNAGSLSVNLRNWTLADLGSERHTINADLIIDPGAYVILARNGDPATNGGVNVHYLYRSFTLSNGEDEIILLTPDGTEADRVVWGSEHGLEPRAGISLERTVLDNPGDWVPATTPWPGSAGDLGSPGVAYTAAPVAATPTPAVTPPTAVWPIAPAGGPLLIDEILYRGSEEEFIVLINLSAAPVDLTGWSIGDAQAPKISEGMMAFPDGDKLEPGALYIIARDGAAFRNQWGKPANAEWTNRDPHTPDLTRRKELATGSITLNDSGDEVLLLNPALEVVDAVAFGKGDYAALGLTGLLQPPKGYSLQRTPDARYPAVSDVRHRFLFAPPRPFEPRGLPLAQVHDQPALAGGLRPVWGSLGAQSNFSLGLTAPPHYLAAAAGAQGLDFLILADPSPTFPWRESGAVLALTAWQWQGSQGERAIVYASTDEGISDAQGLAAYLSATGTLAQWQDQKPLDTHAIPAIAADDIDGLDGLSKLYKRWAAANAPLLPAGNSNPPLPGATDPSPRYTGLAVATLDQASLLEAVGARRGWLTSAPGLWLTLQAKTSGGSYWMGSIVPADNELTFHIQYGDRTGQVAGLALWQDNRLLASLDAPPAQGRWTITAPAMPGAFFYVVATQADGDFAITAPIQIALDTNGTVLLNEVLPAPAADHNGDGNVDGKDEFIELYNPGTQPVSLAGWQLSDNTGDANPARRFTFGSGELLKGGERRILWQAESWINLNVENDFVRLLRPDGSEADQVRWDEKPPRRRSLSRYPDGEAWINDAQVTPGEPNARAQEDIATFDYEGEQQAWAARRTEGTGRKTYTQRGGLVASVAQARNWGLKVYVEFFAVVTTPAGIFDRTFYVADAEALAGGTYASTGIHVYVDEGELPALQAGDRIFVRGVLSSFRGEMELYVARPEQITFVERGTPLLPKAVTVSAIGERYESQLVTFRGIVTGWQGDSIFLSDPLRPGAPAIRVVVRESLGWQRPYVRRGELWQVTGIVSQFAREAPWNGGYRVLVRFENDLVRLARQ
jgi:hypothetical protein